MDETGCPKSSISNRDDFFWSDDDRELELIDDKEDVEYAEEVVREEAEYADEVVRDKDENKFERRLQESSISGHSLPYALPSLNDLPIFSLDNDDELVSEEIEDLEELLRLFFNFVLDKTALSIREIRRLGEDRFAKQSSRLSASQPLTKLTSGMKSLPWRPVTSIKPGFPNRPFLSSRPSDLSDEEGPSAAATDRKQDRKILLLPLFFFLLSSVIAREREGEMNRSNS